MSEQIIIYIPDANSSDIPCIALNDNLSISKQALINWQNLNSFCENWEDKIVSIIINGSLCTYLRKKIPARSQKQIRTALPFSVEEQFSQDIECFHFAISSKDANGFVEAECIDESILEALLNKLHRLEIIPNAVYADHQLIPSFEDAHSIFVMEDQIIVRLMSGEKFNSSYELFDIIFSNTLDKEIKTENENTTEEDLEEQLLPKCYLLFESYSKKQQQFKKHFVLENENKLKIILDVNTQDKVQENNPLNTFLKELQTNPINLLQGKFKQKTLFNKNWLLWKQPLIAASLLIGLLFANAILNYQVQKGYLDDLLQAQKKVYLNTFRNEKRVLRPVSQMRGKLKRMAATSPDGKILPLLNKLSSAVQSVNNTQISDISFRSNRGEMKIDFVAPDFNTIQKFQQQLKNLGLEIKPGATNQIKDAYKGRVTIKEQGV